MSRKGITIVFFSDSQNNCSLKYHFRHLEYQGDLKQIFSRQLKAIESWLLHFKSHLHSFLVWVFFPVLCWANIFLFRIQYSGPDRSLQGCLALFQYNKWMANFSLLLFPSGWWMLVSVYSSWYDSISVLYYAREGLGWKQTNSHELLLLIIH